MDRSFFLFAATAATLCSSESLASSHSIECDGDTLIRQVIDDGDFKRHSLGAEHHFSLFKRRFGKSYATEEEHDLRLKIFKANMRQALRHQSFDPSVIHGVTQFSDLIPSEFREAFLGLQRNRLRLPVDTNAAPILPTENLPIHFDWRERSVLTAVKNQCDPEGAGSCDSGCNGGSMNSAFEYTLKVGCNREACKFDRSKIAAASVANFSVVSLDEDQIAENLVENGSLAIAINAVFMQSYIGGVSCPFICSKRLEHGVLLVGYGSADYWIIKNSWGENGYYRICRGRNICGVDSLVSTVAAVHTPIAAAGQ